MVTDRPTDWTGRSNAIGLNSFSFFLSFFLSFVSYFIFGLFLLFFLPKYPRRRVAFNEKTTTTTTREIELKMRLIQLAPVIIESFQILKERRSK